MKAVVIPADPGEPVRKFRLSEPYTEVLMRLVGDPLKVLDTTHPPGTVLFNRDGELLDLPHNARATGLLYVVRPVHGLGNVIYGDCLVAGPAAGDMPFTGISRLWRRFLIAP